MKDSNPVTRGMNSICGGVDAAIARVFGVTRQSVGQWRRYNKIPRHYMRTFCELSGVTISEMLEWDEVNAGVNFKAFVKEARKRAKEEEDSD